MCFGSAGQCLVKNILPKKNINYIIDPTDSQQFRTEEEVDYTSALDRWIPLPPVDTAERAPWTTRRTDVRGKMHPMITHDGFGVFKAGDQNGAKTSPPCE